MTSQINYTPRYDLTGTDALRLADDLAVMPLDDASEVILHMENVWALDASGVAMLVRVHGKLAAVGGRLELRAGTPPVLAILTATGLKRLWMRAPTTDKVPGDAKPILA